RTLGHSVILDGEIVAFSDRILPFAVIQTRLGRRKVSEKLLAEAPVAFFAFDILFIDGQALFETPLHERALRLTEVVSPHPGPLPPSGRGWREAPDEGRRLIRLGDRGAARDGAHLEARFDAARARANEGPGAKDPQPI